MYIYIYIYAQSNLNHGPTAGKAHLRTNFFGQLPRKMNKRVQYGEHKPPTFELSDKTNWLTFLQDEGYVVIKDIIDEETNRKVTKTFKREWCDVSPDFKWDDTGTWTPTNSPMVWGKSSAMFNGLGQSEFMWTLRTQPNIKAAFAAVYNTTELAVSLDGFSVFLRSEQKSPKWLHQDQRSNDNRLSIQGTVNLRPVSHDDAGLVVVPKSHITHVPPESKTDWVMLDKNDPHYHKALKLLIPRNALVLWNSKTIHSNTGMSSKHRKNPHLNRLSAYITFVPKSRQTSEVVEERRRGYLRGDSCSHWADRHEIKKIPFRIRKRYLARNFNTLKPKLRLGKIPNAYLELL